MGDLPEIGEDQALRAVKVRRPPPLVTLVRAVAVPIPSQEHRIEAYSCDICHCLAPGIGTLELHPAAELPSDDHLQPVVHGKPIRLDAAQPRGAKAHNRYALGRDRKSTRLNSSHGYISYAVFCLKKKNRRNTRSHAQETDSG